MEPSILAQTEVTVYSFKLCFSWLSYCLFVCWLFTFALVIATVVCSSAVKKVKMCPQKPVLF